MSSSPSASEPIVSVHDLGKCHRIYDRPNHGGSAHSPTGALAISRAQAS